jgi:membrane-associated protein
MDLLSFALDFVLRIDKHLAEFVTLYGAWVYALLFAIIFIETGVVVMPFLPGDSLLFVVGALCGLGLLQLSIVIPLLVVAAVGGDQLNYSIGRYFGPKVWQWEHSRFFNKRAFHQAHDFYEKYGGITIMLARFLPFIRTFVPFVAGVAEMSRRKFTLFNVAGALVWVIGLITAGHLFGNLPWAKANMSVIIWAMIIVPGLIALLGAWRARRKALLAAPGPVVRRERSARRSSAAQMRTAASASSMTRPIVMKPWIWRSKRTCVARLPASVRRCEYCSASSRSGS